MNEYWAVMRDETGLEFGVPVKADCRVVAHDYLRQQYPESVCISLDDEEDMLIRERMMYQLLVDIDDDY